MALPILRIRSTGATTAVLELDGKPLRCFSLTLEGNVGEPWVATVQMHVTPDIEVPAGVDIKVVEVTTLEDESRRYAAVPTGDKEGCP